MMQDGQKVIYGSLDDVKMEYANFKCTIRGQNQLSDLDVIPGVQRIEQTDATSILYLEKDIQPTQWLKQVPDKLSIQEMSLNRISLHEIFIDIAADKQLLKGGEVHA